MTTMALAELSRSPGVLARGTAPAGCVALALSAGAPGHCFYEGAVLKPDELAVAGFGREFDFRAIGASDLFVVCLSESLVCRYAEVTWQTPFRERTVDRRLTGTRSTISSIAVPTLRSLLQSLRDGPQLLAESEAAHCVERILLNTLLGSVELPDRPTSNVSRARIARKAEEYLRAQLTEPVTIFDLCEFTGTSERTLHLAFLESFGISPKQLLKTLRLNAARRALRHPTSTTTVTSVAMDWGFYHLGRFSIAYRTMFGETPLATLRRATTVGERARSTGRPWAEAHEPAGARAAA
jgi:AraC family ethanolamine operon transcriptional activator